VRFHTRVPVVDPSRINAELVAALKASGKMTYVALHANHPRELTDAAKAACGLLTDSGIAMVSQTVLLKGINDDADVLADLMRGFVEMRVQPYYLHHPDLAPGTAHFRMRIAEGQAIVAALRSKVSGLCQPRYMLDIPGGFGKVEISATLLSTDADGQVQVTDPQGRVHLYPPV
jgi:lysine 2,3-aminomutase